MPLLIRYRHPDGSLQALNLSIGDDLTLGREAAAADVAIDDRQLSRSHCRLHMLGSEHIVVEDTDSSNGTWLNGARISAPVEVVAGDVITIGATELSVEEVPHDSNDPLVGRRIGDFEVLGILGRGAYGVVYRGLQTNLARSVAIKVLKPAMARSQRRRQDFVREARHAGRLSHPNLVQVHDVIEIDGLYLMVMEYAEGGSIADQIQAEGPLDLRPCLQVLVDIGNALAYAHQQGYVHRDVKPANILACGESYKLGDLGIAARMGEAGRVKMSHFAGSPAYLAPEQAMGKAVDGRADIYGLGASIWHMLTGQAVYQGTAREVIQQQIEAPLPDLRRLVSNVPGPILSLINRMMAKAPIERIQDIQHVVDIAQPALDYARAAQQRGEAPRAGAARSVRRKRVTRHRPGRRRGPRRR